jgi:hypothetical protein
VAQPRMTPAWQPTSIPLHESGISGIRRSRTTKPQSAGKRTLCRLHPREADPRNSCKVQRAKESGCHLARLYGACEMRTMGRQRITKTLARAAICRQATWPPCLPMQVFGFFEKRQKLEAGSRERIERIARDGCPDLEETQFGGGRGERASMKEGQEPTSTACTACKQYSGRLVWSVALLRISESDR